MRRRDFILASAAASIFAPFGSSAEGLGFAYRIGVLAQDVQPGLLEAFRDELQKLGLAEGKDVVIELRNAGGRDELLPALAQQLLRLKVDLRD
jgi:hypothetical protein